MNNKMKGFLVLGLLSMMIAGCGMNTTNVETNGVQTEGQTDEQNNAVNNNQDNNQEQELPIQKLAPSIELTYDFGHSVETVDAELWLGQSDYYIYLPDTVTAEQSENGMDIITTFEVPTSTMTIEVINKNELEANINASKDQIAATYPDQLISEDGEVSPFTAKLLHQVGAMDEHTSTFVYFLEIEDKVFKITQHKWISEMAETVRFIAMINTIGTFSDSIVK